MIILLLGYRGSGKSTVGQILASRLQIPFLDTDSAIIQHYNGLSIKDIWSTHGEPAFRKTEAEIIQKALAHHPQIIALGGGAVMHPSTRQLLTITPNLVRIYLRADAHTLHSRIQADPASAASRPALTDKSSSIEEIEHVLAGRSPVYQVLADQVIDVAGLGPAQVVDRIVAKLGPSLGPLGPLGPQTSPQ